MRKSQWLPSSPMMAAALVIATAAIAVAAPNQEATAAAAPCRPIPGAGEVIDAGMVVLLGELHGTEESPAFVLDLACLGVRAGLPVWVGLEMPPAGQEAMNAYLSSSGGREDRDVLLGGEPWQSKNQWGQTSEAIFLLIEGLRGLREAGHDVHVVLFDAPDDGSGRSRDQRMADVLAVAAGASSEGLMLVQTGNLHSRVTLGSPWQADFEAMGYLLRKVIPPGRLLSLNVAHAGGTAYACVSGGTCGAQRFGAQGPEGTEISTGISVLSPSEADGHDGWYHVGTITASQPAVPKDR